jgi:chloramphenicol-sensitive protein RarD
MPMPPEPVQIPAFAYSSDAWFPTQVYNPARFPACGNFNPMQRAAEPIAPPTARARAGLFYALGAYLAWGIIPSYFKLLAHVPPLVVLAHRVVWSVVFLLLLLALQHKWGEVRDAVRNRRVLAMLCGSTVMIAVNWYVFIWAVSNKLVLYASLGYFINPLVNVLLGVVVLRERLRPGQVAGLLLAATGVAVLTVATGGVPWVALSLAFSFGFYGLLRKTAHVGPLAGLSIETAILLPAAVLVVAGLAPAAVLPGGTPPVSRGTFALLATAGVVTAVPLLLFAAGARRLRLSTLGFLQYLAPTCQFLLAVAVYHEPFRREQLVSFAFIWAGLLVYTLETVVHLRGKRTSSVDVEASAVMVPD